MSVSPSGEVMEGSTLSFTCSSDANPAATYSWYKENEKSPKAEGKTYNITDVRVEHSGNYYCEARNNRGRRNSTSTLTAVAGEFLSSPAHMKHRNMLVQPVHPKSSHRNILSQPLVSYLGA